MCLVLNKIDRLCIELKLTIDEAFEHIHRVLESVNAIISGK
jgi:translation elongation factor EF-G